MAQPEAIQNGNTVITPHPTCMDSVNRISKLPVVESTIQTATSIYEKVKDYNSVTNWTITTAEGAVQKAVEVGKPVATPIIQNFEGPIKKVDAVLCSGLDYVESKVPAVKLPPSEIYTNTKDYLSNTVSPTVETAKAYAEPAVQTARDYVEPALKTAMDMVQPTVDRAMHAMEPTIEMAKHYVEPLVQPAMETVSNIKHRVEELLHREHNHQGDEIECADCQQIRDQLEQEKRAREQKEQQQEQPQPAEPQSEQPQPQQHDAEVQEADSMEHE